MSQDYNEYLAANVLNEQQLVSYRNLSRALKVHSNIAKQMLYEFHRKQNSKKPGSVHATYLIAGTKRLAHTPNGPQSQDDGEDSTMQSSPPLPSSSFPRPDEDVDDHDAALPPVKSIVLAREEHLEQAKAQFEDITSIHIYSLHAQGLSDFQSLTECNRRVAVEHAADDPLKEWRQYGVIQNPHVKRRTRRNGPPIAAAPAKKVEPIKTKPTAAAAAPAKAAKEDGRGSKAPSRNPTPEPPKKPTVKPAAKKGGSIFASFAKGAAKPTKTASQQSSGAPSPAAEPADVDMTGFSDDEDDGESGLPEELEDVKAPSGPSKKDRKAELEAMMEQEDEPMEDADSPPAEEEQQHDEGAIDEKEAEAEEPKETVTVENGRRRGRRRVMKKKTVKDEEGYLVTKEEAVWESFSEDEPAPKKARVQVSTATKASNDNKGAKKGQGNIMSFFSKK